MGAGRAGHSRRSRRLRPTGGFPGRRRLARASSDAVLAHVSARGVSAGRRRPHVSSNRAGGRPRMGGQGSAEPRRRCFRRGISRSDTRPGALRSAGAKSDHCALPRDRAGSSVDASLSPAVRALRRGSRSAAEARSELWRPLAPARRSRRAHRCRHDAERTPQELCARLRRTLRHHRRGRRYARRAAVQWRPVLR